MKSRRSIVNIKVQSKPFALSANGISSEIYIKAKGDPDTVKNNILLALTQEVMSINTKEELKTANSDKVLPMFNAISVYSYIALLGGLDRASEGSIRVRGVEMNKLSDEDESSMRRNDIGFVFQAYNLVENLTLEENILLPALLEGKKRRNVLKRAEELMKLVGILERRNHTPKELSGGEQQRTAIARALINEPDILFADEPIGNLDSRTGTEILRLLQQINKEKGITILMVTHSEESTQYGNRIIRLRDGEIVA